MSYFLCSPAQSKVANKAEEMDVEYFEPTYPLYVTADFVASVHRGRGSSSELPFNLGRASTRADCVNEVNDREISTEEESGDQRMPLLKLR